MTSIPPEWQAILDASEQIEQDYAAERDKNRKLARELTRIQFEKEILVQQLEAKERRIAQLESRTITVTDPEVVRGMNQLVHVEHLKRIYEIRGWLASKRSEIAVLERALERFPSEHPERQEIERIVRGHIDDRENIEYMLKQVERRLEEHCS